MDKMTPDQLIYHCKLSQQMSRHDESTRILQEMLKRGSLFGATERCLLNVAYSEALKQHQVTKRKLIILIEECHLQIKKVRPYIEVLEEHEREMRSVARKLELMNSMGRQT